MSVPQKTRQSTMLSVKVGSTNKPPSTHTLGRTYITSHLPIPNILFLLTST